MVGACRDVAAACSASSAAARILIMICVVSDEQRGLSSTTEAGLPRQRQAQLRETIKCSDDFTPQPHTDFEAAPSLSISETTRTMCLSSMSSEGLQPIFRL